MRNIKIRIAGVLLFFLTLESAMPSSSVWLSDVGPSALPSPGSDGSIQLYIKGGDKPIGHIPSDPIKEYPDPPPELQNHSNKCSLDSFSGTELEPLRLSFNEVCINANRSWTYEFSPHPTEPNNLLLRHIMKIDMSELQQKFRSVLDIDTEIRKRRTCENWMQIAGTGLRLSPPFATGYVRLDVERHFCKRVKGVFRMENRLGSGNYQINIQLRFDITSGLPKLIVERQDEFTLDSDTKVLVRILKSFFAGTRPISERLFGNLEAQLSSQNTVYDNPAIADQINRTIEHYAREFNVGPFEPPVLESAVFFGSESIPFGVKITWVQPVKGRAACATRRGIESNVTHLPKRSYKCSSLKERLRSTSPISEGEGGSLYFDPKKLYSGNGPIVPVK